MSMPLASLPASERAALARIVQAARLMDVLYMRQVWPGTASLVARLAVASGAPAQAQLEALLFRKGPWLPTGEAFIAGAPATRPPGDFYPPDSTKDEIDAWLKQLPEGEHRQAMNPFRVLRREAAGRFASFPYSVIYGSELTLAARLLNEAAGLTRRADATGVSGPRARGRS